MKHFWVAFVVLVGCVAVRPYVWRKMSTDQESEYAPYMKSGSGTVIGQAFLQRRDGITVRAAGRIVTLDPATSIGQEWWDRPVHFVHEYFDVPPSYAFLSARRCVRADADGNFRFEEIPSGMYYLQTSVTWQPGRTRQGGMVGKVVEVRGGEVVSVVLGPAAYRIDRENLRPFFVTRSGPPLSGNPEPVCPK